MTKVVLSYGPAQCALVSDSTMHDIVSSVLEFTNTEQYCFIHLDKYKIKA